MTTAPKGLHFGTAGVPFSAADDSSLAGIERIKELGLDALELEFVQGVKMGLDTAAKVREKAGRARRPAERPRPLSHQLQLRRPRHPAAEPGAARSRRPGSATPAAR